MASRAPARVPRIRFGAFELDVRDGELRKHGQKVRLQEQPFQILALLLERPGELVTRDELRERLWPSGVVVDFDHNLNKAVNKLREALGDSADRPSFIETIPKRGYRFIGPVEDAGDASAPPGGTEAGARRLRTERAEARRPFGMAFGPKALLTGLGLLAVLAAGAWAWHARTRPGVAPAAGRIMLAVLPFQNLSANADQEYFSDGLTEEMIAQLGRLQPERLRVIARTSAMQYKNSGKRVQQIGRELGVDYVIEGSVRRAGDRVRISAKLVQAGEETNLWAETYERHLADVFAIQSEVARQIAGSLALELLPGQRAALGQAPTVSPAAHEEYLKGRFQWSKRTEDGLVSSLDHFRRAVEHDPGYALGYVGIADSYNLLADYGARAPNEALPRSKAAALKALEIDGSLAEAHASLGWTALVYDRDPVAAEASFKRAIALNPGYASAHQWYAYCLKAMGRHAEALAEARRAQELDPLSLIVNAVVGWHHYLAREYDAAIEQCRRVIEMDPRFPRVYSYLGWAYLQKGRHEEGLAALRKARELFGDSPARQAELAHGYAMAGRRREARQILRELRDAGERRYLESGLIARVYAALGDRDQAFQWLDRAIDEHDVKLILLKVDPALDPLRADARFPDLLRRAGLAQ